jgi:hypothetical protein
MSAYHATAASNTFRVRDRAAFAHALDRLPIRVESAGAADEPSHVYLACESDDGRWPAACRLTHQRKAQAAARMQRVRDMPARELGRGLMRGDRAQLKLGYSGENAALAVREIHQLSEREAAVLDAYLEGFAAGMRRAPELSKDVGLRGACADAYDEGTSDGLGEPITRTYPADSDHASPAARASEVAL